MNHDPLVILDFETTGLSPERGDRITEVGLVRVERGRIVDRFESLANAGVRVPAHITAFTGITQAMVDSAPHAADVMRRAVDFIGDTPVVAHNAAFDRRFFLHECRRGDIGVLSQPFLCSMRLARRVYPDIRSHSLAELGRVLELGYGRRAHRAGADAEVTAQLVLRLAEAIGLRHGDEPVTEKLLRRVMSQPRARAAARAHRLCA